MRKLTFKAFSLVELLVVITILAIIWAVWVSLNDWYKEKTYNTKVITDLATIENALIRYKQENAKVPSPEGNLKYFTNDWSYAHDETDAYWFHWFITESTIPKKFINVLPRDPRSKQYYAYWKTINWWNFEVSWVLSYREKFESAVRWNYEWKDPLYNLIREYNWPDYVYDKSIKNFPYNPEDMIVTARITSFTWDILLNDKILSKEEVLNKNLIAWDNIKLSTWSTATIYYSDWSYSQLWDPSIPLELTLSVMKYKKDDNLFTRVRLALNFWTILTKASKMTTESNFDLYTTDTEASVRWTIFSFRRVPWEGKTTVTVIKWSILLNWISIPTYENLLEILKKDQEISPKNLITLLPPSVLETKIIDWENRSIFKGPYNTIIISWGVFCSATQHIELWICVENTIPCPISNWIWKQNRNVATLRWTCLVDSCNTWFVAYLNLCVPNTCSWPVPTNWKVSNATSTNLWTRTYDLDCWNCTYKCAENYNWNLSNCVADTKTYTCSPISVSNSTWNTVDHYTQTWDWTKWSPIDSVTSFNNLSSPTECRFKCNTNYIYSWWECVFSCPWWTHQIGLSCISDTQPCNIPYWAWQMIWPSTTCNVTGCNTNYKISWNSCIPETRDFKCNSKPSNSNWNSVSEYNQEWNWSSWVPANSSTEYSLTPSSNSCKFKCSWWANWDWSSCVICTSPFTWCSTHKKCDLHGVWCNQCPPAPSPHPNKITNTYYGKCYKVFGIWKWSKRDWKCSMYSQPVCWKEGPVGWTCPIVQDYPWVINQ